MSRLSVQILSGALLVLLLTHCAQIGTLGGGPRDLEPPKLLEAIPKNKSVDINTNSILLRFDEFVQMKNPDQLVITPRLKTAPEVVAEGKTILIRFKQEELMPSTTYRFLFGACIADMHETNLIKDFEFVFSTGPQIDTLKLSGEIQDASSNQPLGSVMVGLYDANLRSDSMPYKYTPEYITKTGADGKFLLSYLPHRPFEIFAISDNNKNNLYDGDAEKVAFYGPTMNLISDTAIKLCMFQEEAPKTYIKKVSSPYFGFGQIVLNKKARIKLDALNAAQNRLLMELNKDVEKDTIRFFYKGLNDSIALKVKIAGNSKTDTLKMVLPRNNAKRKIKSSGTNATLGILELNQKLQINFPVWMDTAATARLKGIRLKSKDDTLIGKQNITGKWVSVSAFEISNSLKEGDTYILQLDTAVFKDMSGLPNDSDLFTVKCRSKVEFGKATVKLKLNKKQSYVVQLLNEQQKVTQQRFLSFTLSSSNAVTLDFADVLPGNYTLKVIYDNNENKKWDGGDLSFKKLPEQVFISQKLLKVLADWEIEEEILVKE